MLTRILTILLGILKRTNLQEDDHDMPITEPMRIAVKPLVRNVPPALVSQAISRPGVLARSFARGQLDLRDGQLVPSTVEDTLTRRLPHWSKRDENGETHPAP